MRQGKEQKARDIWNVRESMMVPNVKPSVECAFVNNAPSDITAFLASPYVKTQKNMGVLDKKYGDNLQFLLETDSAITGRTVTNDSGKNAEPTKFYTVCDEKGVKFLFIMPCDSARAKALQNGYGGFGGFEMYFTTGYDQPYDCLLIDCPPNVSVGDNFITQYDNMGFRRACRENDNLNVSFRIDDDKVLMLLEIDWRAAVNGIPSNGFRWELEPIHWERGGWDWGGSKSVHNRSSFGDVVFANMTPENAAKIKRRLLSYAAKAYNAELTSR